MNGQSAYLGLRCLRCGAEYPHGIYLDGCSRCATEKSRSNLTCVFDYAALRRGNTFSKRSDGNRGLWSWHELLPARVENAITLAEGGTPLLHLRRLGEAWGLPNLYAKDETRNPTWSYKDRLNSVGISAAVERGASAITVSSTGNHGASTAAYAARAGLPCVVFTTSSVPTTMKTLMQSYGAFVVALPTLEDRWRIMAEAVAEFGWYPMSNGSWPPVGSTPYGIEGYKSIAYEIRDEHPLLVPDFVVVPTAFGDGLYGTWKGFKELEALGLTDRLPKMVAAEPFGPLAHALAHNLDEGERVASGKTVSFSIGSPLGTHQALVALKESQGAAYAVGDEETMSAQSDLARLEGIFAEPSSCTALAATRGALASGAIHEQDSVCVVLTSTGLKDPLATHERLGAVPEPEPTLAAVLHDLERRYGYAVSR